MKATSPLLGTGAGAAARRLRERGAGGRGERQPDQPGPAKGLEIHR